MRVVWNDVLAVIIGGVTGAAMCIATSCVWCVLHLPARIQDRLRALSPRSCAFAISCGLLLSALRMCFGLTLGLPHWVAALAFVAGGMFVGMLAAALGEITEVVPVLMHRFRVNSMSYPLRLTLTIGKGLGAIIACLAVTLH